MATPKTITAANSVFLLAIAGVYPIPIQIEGFAADSAFAVDSVDLVETVMGVDGKLSAGYTPVKYDMSISIMPDSGSLSLFETWATAMNVAREVFYASGQIIIPSINRKYVLTKGVLTSTKPLPDVKKVLQAIDYKITWESINPSLV